MLQRFLLITLTLCSLTASAQWQQTGSKVRYVNGLGIPTKDTAAGVAADSSQIVIRPADSSLYVKYKRTWLRVGGGGGSIAGSGTTNYVPKFTSASAIGNSQIFDNGTNVGINTTTPGYKLNLVYTQSSNTFQGFSINATTIGKNYGILSGNATGGGLFGLTNPFTGFINYTDAAATSYINDGSGYFSWHNSTAELMRLTNGGNVGIGTASPSEKLHLAGNTFRQNDASNSFGYTISTTSATTTLATLFGGSSFGIRTGGSGSDNLRITSAGDVGIGTTSPAYGKLQISGGADSYLGGLSFYQGGGSIGSLYLKSNGSGDYNLILSRGGSDITGLSITPTGNVGIGYTAPAAKLAVSGTTLINTNTDNGVDKLQVSGSAISTQYKLSALNTAPATASSTGTLGEIRIDANYIYICTATNTWKRVAIATW